MYRTRARMLTATAIVAALLPIGATGDAADREESRGVTCDEPVTRRASVSNDEEESTRHSSMPSISGDGRFVAFASKAPNLVPGDDNHQFDVFVRDRLDGTTELVSASTSGEIGNGASLLPAISRNGQFVAFNSEASNFVPGDVDPTGGEGALEVFVHDRQTGVTERIAFSSDGGYVPLPSFSADISSRGRYVVFAAAAALTPEDDNITYDIYVRDRETATTELVSVPESGPHRNLPSLFSAISGNGRFVTFESSQPGLVPGDTNRWNDVFVTDRRTGEIERVSVDSSGGQARKGSSEPDISRDGRFVTFVSNAKDLIRHDTNGTASDVFVHDRASGRTTLVSRSTNGRQSPLQSNQPSISDDGTKIAFISAGGKLVDRDTNDALDVFVRDRAARTTVRVSVGPGGRQVSGNVEPYTDIDISGDGASVAFDSKSAGLIPHDTNGRADVFVFGRPPACGAPS